MPPWVHPPHSVAVLFAALVLAAPTGTRAATSADDAGATCADPAVIQRLLASQRRGGPLRADEGWRLRYHVESDGGDRWQLRLDVLGDDGRLYLTRVISHSSGDCQTLAEAAALIVERFFTELDWTSGRPLPPPAELAATVAQPSPPSAPPSPPLLRSLLVTARVGAWTRSQRTAAGALGLRWEGRLLDGELSLLLPATNQEETRPAGGKAASSAIASALSIGGHWQPGRLQVRGGPIAVVGHERARAEGIRLQNNKTRFTLAAGLSAGTSYAVSRRWRLGLDIWGTVAALGDRFVVEGWGTVLAPPRFQIAALLGAHYALWP